VEECKLLLTGNIVTPLILAQLPDAGPPGVPDNMAAGGASSVHSSDQPELFSSLPVGC